MRTVLTVVILGMMCSITAHAQQGQLGPWAQHIPDPDTFDWTAQDRPGYRYRGMTPTHEKFYAYIQDKRNRGVALSWADRMMIRRLQSARRWPEAPEPNEKWKSFLRYLREQPTMDMNVAQRMMFLQALSQGVLPWEPRLDPTAQRLVDHLGSRPYYARNWFERTFGRVEPWMEMVAAASGADMRPDRGGGGGGRIFPADGDFVGMRISYDVSGIQLGDFEDREGFTDRRTYTGTVAPGRITVSGTASMQRGWEAKLRVYMMVGTESVDEEWTIISPGTQDFSVTIDVPEGTNLSFPVQPQFYIRLTGSFSTAGRGSARMTRGLLIHANLSEDEGAVATRHAREDAEWRAEVERTLRELGYQQSPAGREVARMQEAARGGAEAWQEYVDERHRELAAQETDAERDFAWLEQALAAGGDVWDNYVRTGGADASPTQPPVAPEETAPRTSADGGAAEQAPATPAAQLAITDPAENDSISANQRIRGTAPPGSRVRVTVRYWYRVLVEGYARLHEIEVTADDAGNWATEELDMRPPLSGMSRSYRIKVEQLGADGAVIQEEEIEVRSE